MDYTNTMSSTGKLWMHNWVSDCREGVPSRPTRACDWTSSQRTFTGDRPYGPKSTGAVDDSTSALT